MKLNQMLKNAERKVVDFTHNPDKMRGLFTGIAITVVGALLVNEVKDSKHKKEVKDDIEATYGLGLHAGVEGTLAELVSEDILEYEKADDAYRHINKIVIQEDNPLDDTTRSAYEYAVNNSQKQL